MPNIFKILFNQFYFNVKYVFLISRGKELPSLNRSLGATVACPKFQCKIEKRIQN